MLPRPGVPEGANHTRTPAGSGTEAEGWAPPQTKQRDKNGAIVSHAGQQSHSSSQPSQDCLGALNSQPASQCN